jgi:hypothetical protein
MNEREYTVLVGPNRTAIGRTLSMSAAAAAPVFVSIALAAIDLASALGLSRSIPGECH